MLILNEHASHIITAAIKYCEAHKIILLCLSAHTTHILQSLNVRIFASLIIAYKVNV